MKRDSVKNHDEARVKKKKEQREKTFFRFLIILIKGKQEINCAAGVYSRDSGRLLSDCTTVVLNICYE